MTSIKMMLTGIMFVLVSIFLLGVRIINKSGVTLDILAIILIIVGVVLFLCGLIIVPLLERKTDDSSDEEGDNISKTVCPNCNKEHDIDYPKCPYCKHQL